MRAIEAGLSWDPWSTAAEGAGAQLRFAGERYDAGNESGEGDLSGTSDRLRRPGCLLPAEPGAMAREVDRAGSATASGVSLPATGHAEAAETGIQEGDAERIRATPGLPNLKRDSGVGARSDCSDLGEGGQSAPVSDQAAVLGLLWVGSGDTLECGLSLCGRQSGEAQTGADDAWVEPEFQSSAQVRL